MFGQKTFYDKYWNFDNNKFIKLLQKARKENLKQKDKWKWLKNKDIMLFPSVSKKEAWQFVNKLSIFLNSWVDIKWALGILIKQTKNPYMKEIVTEIKNNIDHWISISDSMAGYPKVFDELTTALVSVWEQTWKLWVILNELDTTLLENIELKWKVKGAMIYPMILLFLTISMVVFMMVFIIPKITESFDKAGSELPGLTQFVVWISDFLIEKWYILLIWIFLLVVVIKIINSTYLWKIFFSTLFTKLPIFGFIVKQSNVVYFIKAFTLLQNSWVLLLEALRTSSRVVPNLLYKKELIRIKNEVEVWLTISKSLWLNLEYETSIYNNNLFSEEFAYVVSTGEETWSLSKSLDKIWKNYNWELKRYIWNLSSMMEPVIIVIVWILVWVIVVAIMLPFFALGDIAWNM